MPPRGFDRLTLTAAMVMLLSPGFASGGVLFSNLCSFQNLQTGYDPRPRLVWHTNGYFYGTTSAGGAHDRGTVFKATVNGAVTTLATFDGTNGGGPYGGLMLANDGNFYGTTLDGGASNLGTVFRVTLDGSLSVLVSFTGTNGEAPGDSSAAGLIQGKDGYLYGTTEFGGDYDAGTVFAMTLDGKLNTIFSFQGPNGLFPEGELLEASDGNLYGTTGFGGDIGGGTAFRLTPDHKITFLASFNGSNGYRPGAGLFEGKDGNLYGVTEGAISGNYGSVFCLTTNGLLRNLVTFNGTNGATPLAALIQATDGNLYGTTTFGGPTGRYGPGTIFQIAPNGTFAIVHAFSGTNDGVHPRAALVQAPNGMLYGVTSEGGAYNSGNIFRLSIPMRPALQMPRFTNGSVVLTWTSVAGQTYAAEICQDLSSQNWLRIGTTLSATNGLLSLTYPKGAYPQNFYRVRVFP